MKTREQIKAYNKEYFARPDVIARAKIRNAQRRHVRKAYKKTEQGRLAEKRYATKPESRESRKWRRIYNRYGITRDEYDARLEKQLGLCAICGTKKEVYHIDHCHRTNRVRGILCGNCNLALGLMKDNTEFLAKAIKYLQ